jgi:hypothetical protein
MREAVLLMWLTTALVVSSCSRPGGHDSDGPPEWVKVGPESDSVAVYLSTAPPEKVGGHLLAGLKVFYLTAHHHGPSNNPSTVSIWRIEYDCPNHRSAMRSAVALDRPETDTLDRVVYSTPEWHSDTERPSGRLIAQQVCASKETIPRPYLQPLR